MVTKVAIIGVGHVGAAVAQAMVLRSTTSILYLIDKNDKKAKAEEMDLTDQQALLVNSTQLVAVPYESSWQELADCDVVISAAGNISLLDPKKHNRLGELHHSLDIVEEVAPKLKASGFHGILVNITNPCDVVATYWQQLTGFPRERIVGTGTTLDTTRMKHAVSKHFGCNIQDITGYILGEHGETQFTAWSTVAVAGLPMLQLAQEQNIDLAALKEQARFGGWQIMDGKAFTSYGIGLTGTILTEAILNDSRKFFPLSSYNEKFATYIGQVTQLGAAGVLAVHDLPLPANEQALFAESAQIVHDNLARTLAERTDKNK